MRIRFKNIGRFVEETSIKMDGITIIAGKNGSGKSTISKILYCLFDSFYNLETQIKRERADALANCISRIGRRDRLTTRYMLSSIVEEILSYPDHKLDIESLKRILYEYDFPTSELDDLDYENMYAEIVDILKVSDKEILPNMFQTRIDSEFGGQLKHVNHKNEISYIDGEIRDKIISITYDDKLEVHDCISFIKNIIYMDDMSSIENFRPSMVGNRYSHEANLKEKILFKAEERQSVVDSIISAEKYEKVIQKINEAHVGELVRNANRNFEYVVPSLKDTIKLQNISAGTKVFLIFKQLIKNGYLEENGIMVLDEPEVHMHPEWQKILAEMIVLLQKEMGINFLISSHSAELILFIQYYSEEYGIEGNCNYYNIIEGTEPSTSTLIDVDGKVEAIFEPLSMPYITVSEEMLKYD